MILKSKFKQVVVAIAVIMSASGISVSAKVPTSVGEAQKRDCMELQPWGKDHLVDLRADQYFRAFPARWAARYPYMHEAPKAKYGSSDQKAVRYILVDKQQNWVWLFVDGAVIYDAPMADNEIKTPKKSVTPTGIRYANRCVENNGNLPNFIGLDKTINGTDGIFSGIGIHSIPEGKWGQPLYSPTALGKGTIATAGCINVDKEASQIIFMFATPGTPVIIR